MFGAGSDVDDVATLGVAMSRESMVHPKSSSVRRIPRERRVGLRPRLVSWEDPCSAEVVCRVLVEGGVLDGRTKARLYSGPAPLLKKKMSRLLIKSLSQGVPCNCRTLCETRTARFNLSLYDSRGNWEFGSKICQSVTNDHVSEKSLLGRMGCIANCRGVCDVVSMASPYPVELSIEEAVRIFSHKFKGCCVVKRSSCKLEDMDATPLPEAESGVFTGFWIKTDVEVEVEPDADVNVEESDLDQEKLTYFVIFPLR